MVSLTADYGCRTASGLELPERHRPPGLNIFGASSKQDLDSRARRVA